MGHAPNTLQALEAAAAAHAEEMAGARASYEVQAEALQREVQALQGQAGRVEELRVQLQELHTKVGLRRWCLVPDAVNPDAWCLVPGAVLPDALS